MLNKAKKDEKAKGGKDGDHETRQKQVGTGQVDDNQDDLGRDVNDPKKLGNEVNRKGVTERSGRGR